MDKKILVVEDELHIAKLIPHHLEKSGYEVVHTTHGDEALTLFFSENFDLIILDLMLPGLDGLEICRRIRNQNKDKIHIPIIMLTAKNEEVDKIVGLEMGADDYITKPFSPRELTARIKAQLRGRDKTNEDKETTIQQSDAESKAQKESRHLSYQVGPLDIYPERYEALLDEKVLKLTPKEFELLKLLAINAGQVFTREVLLEKIWGYDYLGDTRTVDVHIRHIRQKISDEGYDSKIVETVRGIGYRLRLKETE